jgi:hypothetical protein
MHYGKDYVIPEEIPDVVREAQENIKKLKGIRTEFLYTIKENKIPDNIPIKDDKFEVRIYGHGESTKQLIEKQFPQCEITVGKWYDSYDYGFGRNEKTEWYKYDALIFKCKY